VVSRAINTDDLARADQCGVCVVRVPKDSSDEGDLLAPSGTRLETGRTTALSTHRLISSPVQPETNMVTVEP